MNAALRAAQLLAVALVAFFLVLPILLSILAGVTANWFLGPGAGLTTRWVIRVLDQYSHTILLSVQLAVSCLAIVLLVAVPAAWALARSPGRWARIVEETAALPLAVPGIAIGIGMILQWGAVGGFRTHWTFVLAGHVLFTLPFMLRAVLAVLARGNLAQLEDAARACGAGMAFRFRTIVLPAARPGIVAGSLMVVALSLGEFNMSLLLTTPFTMTLPVGLADAYAGLRLEVASAYTLVFLVLVVPPLVLLQLLADRLARR